MATSKAYDYGTNERVHGRVTFALLEASREAGDSGAVLCREDDGYLELVRGDERSQYPDARTVYVVHDDGG
jgi:hypothetical protein